MARSKVLARRLGGMTVAVLILCSALAAARSEPAVRFLALGAPACAEDPEMERRLDEALLDYGLEYGMLPAVPRAKAIVPHPYPIHPFGGVENVDLLALDYVDLDPASGSKQDWACGERTYDGHDAVDYHLRSFGEQDGGVPIFTPLAGRVVHAQDGYPDRQLECSRGTENYVQVDHGGGQLTGYGHMRRGSVRVTVGQRVEAGEELGEVASSGCSYWPHLHFVTRLDGRPVETHTGDCNPGGSGWRDQHPIRRGIELWDLGFSRKALDELTPEETPPGVVPRLGHITKKDKKVYLWVYVLDIAPQTPYRLRAIAPNGRQRWDSRVRYSQNPDEMRLAVFWLTIPSKKFRRQWGTWTIELSLDGEVVAEAPLDYFKTAKRSLNRPPRRPDGVVFEPAQPLAAEPLVCVVQTDRLRDDPDYDIVRYFYEWRIDGEIVRERTWAARSDVLAANRAAPGDRVTCTVVPLDDQEAGEAAVAETVIQ